MRTIREVLLVNRKLLKIDDLIKKIVGLGAIDGTTNVNVNKVDGFNLRENSRIITSLHRYLEQSNIN